MSFENIGFYAFMICLVGALISSLRGSRIATGIFSILAGIISAISTWVQFYYPGGDGEFAAICSILAVIFLLAGIGQIVNKGD